MVGDTLPSIRFERPPLQEVSLSLYFEPIETLKVSHLASLRTDWRYDYPRADETPPLPFWTSGRPEAVQVLSPSSPWPLPIVWFVSDDRSLQIQADRFVLSWQFHSLEEHGAKYPGYDALKPELVSRFDEFARTVAAETDATPRVKRAELQYENLFPSYPAIRLTKHLFGVNDQASSLVDGAEYVGIRIHRCSDAELKDCSLLLGVDSAGSADEGSTFTIQASRNIEDNENFAAIVDAIHDVVLAEFLRSVPPGLSAEWGTTRE